jgi:hypothetical protein
MWWLFFSFLFGLRSLYVRQEACSLSLCARLGMRQEASRRVCSLLCVTNGGLACGRRRAISSLISEKRHWSVGDGPGSGAR